MVYTDVCAMNDRPLIFGFASISIVLSSMQVILSIPTDKPGFGAVGDNRIKTMNRAFWVFSLLPCCFYPGFTPVV